VPEAELLSGRVIDVCVWGASRPHLFRRTIAAFRDHVRFSGRLRFFLDDGDFHPERARASASIAESLGFDGVHVERVGSYGFAMTNAFDRWVRAPLMFSLEDDLLALRTLDLDLACDAFLQNPGLNQLFFNRRKNYSNPAERPFVLRALSINGCTWPCMSSGHWYFGPALWRMAYVRPRWKGFHDNVHFGINSARGFLPSDGTPAGPEWHADVLGALTWGPPKEPPFFDHIGREDSIHAAQGRV
jgi:hypothetical protein